MAYRQTSKLEFPLNNYEISGLDFGKKGEYEGVDWGMHLGEDVLKKCGTQVFSIGRGRVVYSALHPGSKEKGNWDNVIIIAHKNPKTKKVFFSLYGHLAERLKERGNSVELGEIIGKIGRKNTPENGWWDEEHLHFSIYVGDWKGEVLPGYFKKEQQRTKFSDWEKPTEFIKKY